MTLRILGIAATAGCLLLPIGETTLAATQAEAIHLLNRMAFGPRPGDVERVMNMGIDGYIDQQLHPETIPMPPGLSARLAKLGENELSQADLIKTYRKVIKAAMEDGSGGAPGGGLAMRNALYRKMAVRFGELRLVPAIESPRQLEEVMVDFWFNHFNVVAGKGLDHVSLPTTNKPQSGLMRWANSEICLARRQNTRRCCSIWITGFRHRRRLAPEFPAPKNGCRT